MDKNILYYDDLCPMCNRFVLYLLKLDMNQKLFFAPLWGSTAKVNFGARHQELVDLDSVILQIGAEIKTESEAALRALEIIKRLPLLTFFLKIVPKILRDSVYRVIARKRKKILSSCPAIPKEYQQRFLP